MRTTLLPVPSASTVLVLGLSLASVVLAHGGDGGEHGSAHQGHGGDGGHMDMTKDKPKDDYPPSYFSHPDHAGLMHGHIALMTFAWILVLPVAVMLSLVSSRYTLVSQLVFLAANALGLLLGIIYNAQTPDLYPGNAHNPIGWIITAVVCVYVLISLVGRVAGAIRGYSASSRHGSAREQQPFIPLSTAEAGYGDDQRQTSRHGQEYRFSGESTEGSATGHTAESLRSNSVSTHVGDDDEMAEHRHKEFEDDDDDDHHHGFETLPLSNPDSASNSLVGKLARVVSQGAWRYVRLAYQVIDRIILPFGFVAFTTGIATYGRFFEGHNVFGGLAHWIKGGVFLWLGIFNLGRWTGSFAEIGWAWNLRPKLTGRRWRPSAEFVESALILFYGSTNIFLEHLGSSNDKWSAQDLEHVSITVLFIGGGLCGMLIESTWIRDLLSTNVADVASDDSYSRMEEEQLSHPATYEFSLNPIPALVILLLGIMMSSHHQHSATSSMVHAQWGNLLLAASFARGLTYVIMYIRPPQSIFPSRPPTELLSSFGLIAGGIIFMASSSDTVEGMVHYGLDAMFLYTVTMGLVGILMAWILVVLAIKGWALQKERRASGHNSVRMG